MACTRRLRDELGVRRGDRIAILSPNRLEVPALFLAAMQLGAAVVPLNPTTPPGDWDYILEHSEARGVLRRAASCSTARRAARGRLRLRGRAAPARPPRRPRRAAPGPLVAGDGDRALHVGHHRATPRGSPSPQASLLANAWSMAVNFRLARRDAAGGAAALSRARARLRADDRADDGRPPRVHRRLTRSPGVRSSAPRRHADQRRADAAAPLLQVASGASACRRCARSWSRRRRSPPPRARLRGQDGVPLVQGWGLSEYTNFACCLSPRSSRRRAASAALRRRAHLDSASPSSGTEVKVVGPDGATCPSANAASSASAATARCWSTSAIRPRRPRCSARTAGCGQGDEGFFRLAGGKPMFFITGRIKEIIIRDGEKFSPLAIERSSSRAAGARGALGRARVPARGPRRGDRRLPRRRRLPTSSRPAAAAVDALPLELRPKVVLHGARPSPAPTPARSSAASSTRRSP